MAKCTVTKTQVKLEKIPNSLEEYREIKESLPTNVKIHVLSKLLLTYMQARQEKQMETKIKALQQVIEYECKSK